MAPPSSSSLSPARASILAWMARSCAATLSARASKRSSGLSLIGRLAADRRRDRALGQFARLAAGGAGRIGRRRQGFGRAHGRRRGGRQFGLGRLAHRVVVAAAPEGAGGDGQQDEGEDASADDPQAALGGPAFGLRGHEVSPGLMGSLVNPPASVAVPRAYLHGLACPPAAAAPRLPPDAAER